jgi:hypothetical protein
MDHAGYTEDSEGFAKKLLLSCSIKTLVKLFDTLPPERQQALRTEIDALDQTPTSQKDLDTVMERIAQVGGIDDVWTNERLKKIIADYFTEESFSKTYSKILKDSLESLIESLIPTLSGAQKEEMQSYLKHFFHQ